MIMMNWAIIIVQLFLLMGNKKLAPADIVKITVPEIVVSAGKSAVIKIEVEIKTGYHIQANKVNDGLLVPATVKIDEDKNITTGRQAFPRAKKFKLEGTDDLLDVYTGVFEIRIPFKTIEKIPKGRDILNGKFHYQACDNQTCLFPKNIEFLIPIKMNKFHLI
jgi:hypothetical protein